MCDFVIAMVIYSKTSVYMFSDSTMDNLNMYVKCLPVDIDWGWRLVHAHPPPPPPPHHHHHHHQHQHHYLHL